MYSESDIEAAIASGAITPQAAAALRESVASGRAAPSVDEESFRLITGFNDIFVSIAAVLLLVAVGWIGFTFGRSLYPFPIQYVPGSNSDQIERYGIAAGMGLAGLFVAATSWGLAEYFTRRRRMALPSILLLGSFVYGVAAVALGFAAAMVGETSDERVTGVIFAGAGLFSAGGAYLHWRRFHVPITIAALTGGLVVTLIGLFFAAVPVATTAWLWVLLAAGVAVFAFAMWWDMSDRARLTRRSDVAFWLHLAAAPMIAHPVFNLIGVMNAEIGAATAVSVILLYIAFGIVALAVDRRALLVSSLVYVLYALAGLFRQFGAVSLNVALTALFIGSALLLLSAFWHPIRRRVVAMLPGDIQGRLPAIDRPLVLSPRPAS